MFTLNTESWFCSEIFNEKALATYYNGPTIANVNIRYASDENWHEKVYNYMEMLYKRLEK